MSPDTSYVLFVVSGQRYALPTDAVAQIVSLPELTVLPGAPRELAGVFDLRGAIMPVLDFSIWLKRPAVRYFLTDHVIVLCGKERPFGIIVNGVTDVCASLPREMILKDLNETSSGIIAGAVRMGEDIVFLPDLQQLVRYAESVHSPGSRGGPAPEDVPPATRPPLDSLGPAFWSVPAEEQPVFHERALSLMRKDSVQDNEGFIPLAVVGLNGEYFGITLECVREFAEARNISRVPCCPEHIIGNMNLRGEVLTVVDVRPVLKMPVPAGEQKKIIVLDHGGLTVGIGIDEVYEATYLDPLSITHRQTTTDTALGEYVSGTAPYGNRVLAIVDLRKLLGTRELVVNEEV